MLQIKHFPQGEILCPRSRWHQNFELCIQIIYKKKKKMLWGAEGECFDNILYMALYPLYNKILVTYLLYLLSFVNSGEMTLLNAFLTVIF